MARKVYVELKVKLVITADEGVEIDDVISNMDYNFSYAPVGADIIETEITDYEITDSK